MQTLKLDLPQDLAALLQGFNQPLERSARELIVLELYRRGSISSGKAAELFEMERFEFVRYASRLGIAFFDLKTSGKQRRSLLKPYEGCFECKSSYRPRTT